MDLFLAQLIVLIWVSASLARRMTHDAIEQLLSTAVLFPALIITGQMVSTGSGHGAQPIWTGGIALLLAGIFWGLMPRSKDSPQDTIPHFSRSVVTVALAAGFAFTLIPLGWLFPEATPSPVWHSTQDSWAALLSLPSADILLHLFTLLYGPPTACQELVNYSAWLLGGLAVYRITGLSGLRMWPRVIVCWLAMAIPPLLASTVKTYPLILSGAALQCGVLFGLQWHQEHRKCHAALAILAVMLGVGSAFALGYAMLFVVSMVVVWWLTHKFTDRKAITLRPHRILSGLMIFSLAFPFATLNWKINRWQGSVEVDPKDSVTSLPYAISGLEPANGPYPQWNLPRVRFALTPFVRVMIPGTVHSDPIHVAYSIGLHRREHAKLEVRLNGRMSQTIDLAGQSRWYNGEVELTPSAETQILDFRDITPATELDWREYLEHYGDVRRYLTAFNIPWQEGALAHYANDGKKEGRIMLTRPIPPPSPGQPYFVFRRLQVLAGGNR